MVTIFGVLVGTFLVGILVFIFYLARKTAVQEFLRGADIRIARAAADDIRNERPWEWRYETFHSVTESDMLKRFWKRPRKFWNSLDFMRSQ